MDAHTGRPGPGTDRLTSRDVRVWVASEPLDNPVLAAADGSAPENMNRPAVDTDVGGSFYLPLRREPGSIALSCDARNYRARSGSNLGQVAGTAK